MSMRFDLHFFCIFSRNRHRGISFIVLFFPQKSSLSLLSLLKEVKPSPDHKMIKLSWRCYFRYRPFLLVNLFDTDTILPYWYISLINWEWGYYKDILTLLRKAFALRFPCINLRDVVNKLILKLCLLYGLTWAYDQLKPINGQRIT